MRLKLIPIFFLIINSVFGNSIVEDKVTLIESADMVVTVDKRIEGLFQTAEISPDQNNLNFVTTKEVEWIKIINNKGEVEFQLPVDSKKVRVNKSLFASGKYELGFVVKGHSEIQYVDIQLK